DGQRAGDRAGGDDDLVVLDLAGGPGDGLHGEPARRVVDLGDAAGEDGAVLERLAQRHHAVARGDVAGSRLGQERLVGHVLVGVDDHQFNLAALDVALQLLAQAFGNVETDVTGTYHDYTFHMFNSD